MATSFIQKADSLHQTSPSHFYIMTSTILRIGSLRDIPQGEDDIIQRLYAACFENKLKELYFWNIDFTLEIVAAVARLLDHDTTGSTSTPRSWSNIKILSCTGLIAEAVSSILTSERVETLVLSGSTIDIRSLSALNAGCRNNNCSLRILRLLGIHFPPDNDITFDALSENTSLEELDLTRSRLGMASSLSSPKAICEHQHLLCLKLEFCYLPDDILSRVLHACHECPSMRELYLSHNYCGKESIQELCTLVGSLLVLDLHHQLQESCWSRLFHSLKDRSTTLKQLDLSGNKISDPDVLQLSLSMESNTSLKYLNLQNCQLTEQGIQYSIAASLPRWKALTTINLGGNMFMDASARAMLEGLKRNYTLQHWGNLFYYKCSDEIQFYLDSNWAGRIILRQAIPTGLWPLVLARVNHLALWRQNEIGRRGRRESVLFLMLHGPALLER